jgi:hypothetical protein
MTSNDWHCSIRESHGSMMAADADDFLDVHFLGDDFLDIYSDAIDEAAADPGHNQRK